MNDDAACFAEILEHVLDQVRPWVALGVREKFVVTRHASLFVLNMDRILDRDLHIGSGLVEGRDARIPGFEVEVVDRVVEVVDPLC